MSLTNKIEKTDLARDALYEKVNTIAEELDSKKQDNLVSGTNIKTINGEDIIGSGDVEIKSGGSGRNVGDIFYTTRQDSELNGAVECNGGTYNIGDFEGEQSVGNLLNAGSLPYVSLTEYENLIIANGSCRAFGWDGGTSFRVPWLNDVYIEAGTATSAGEFINESLPNHRHISSLGGIDVNVGWTSGKILMEEGTFGTTKYTNYASDDNPIYQDGAKVKPDSVRYRAMVQLANEATDEAVITATSALQQISEIVPTITYWE